MRWRDVKHNKIAPAPSAKEVCKNADIFKRAKAFLVDMFMINMPILYIAVYLILGGREAFQQNPLAIFACTMLFGLIVSVFLSVSAQTPGYRAYDIKLVDAKSGEKTGFFRCFWRFLCFILSGSIVVGLFVCFFRKDGKNLHDLLSRTVVIDVKK
ncbi:MAG: RDD family protein [Campylobacteraceae bacterium]|nr:RDD family protein [Campylobacteraceae bacterium]